MSRRNNELRVGSKNNSAASEPVPEAQSFSFSSPTEIVDLPSQGRYYGEEHPLHGVESIEIRFMTAKDEDTLTSKTLLNKGIALDRFLSNIIVDKSININDLLVGDKNALLIAARKTGYGSSYDTKVKCPSCGETSEYSFNLDFCGIDRGSDCEDLNVEPAETGYFHVDLPVSNVRVKIKLMDGKDEARLVHLMKISKKTKKGDATVTDMFKVMITEVNGITRKTAINSFVDSMPAMDSRYLRKVYETIMPKIDMSHNFVCENCGSETFLEVPLNAEFFWPR